MSISRISNKATSSSATTTTTTNQACAACKYQRRKCTPDCLLAPYFPHDRQRQFLNAHKLFGVSNITKIIKNLHPPEKDEAMKTIIFQADARALDPVGGCYRMVLELQRQIEYHKLELDLVLHQLAMCRAQAAGHNFDIQQPVQATQGSNLARGNNEIIDSSNGIALDVYDPTLMQFHYASQDNHQQDYVSAWTTPLQDSSVSSSSSFQAANDKQPSGGNDQCNEDVKAFPDVNDIKFELEELVERRFVPSTELVMSS